MGSFEDYLTDAPFVEAFRATYRGRHDPVDALFWLQHPTEPGPSGADAPAAPLAALKRAAYSRDADPLAEQILASLERELAADRDETLAAIVRARNPLPAVDTAGEVLIFDAETVPVPQRRWPIVVVAVATVLVVLVGIRLAVPDQNSAGPSVANTFVAYTPTPRATDARPTDAQSANVQAGPVTCANLVDVDTLGMFGNMGLTDVSDRVSPESPGQLYAEIGPFGSNGGARCAWSDSTSDIDDAHVEALYGYDPIDDATAQNQIEFLESQGFSKSKNGTVTRYVDGADDYAFGDGFWAYSRAGNTDVLTEVVAHAPEMADVARTDLQSGVYVTSEGLGDLRIGEPVPAPSLLAAWNPTACNDDGGPYSGAWLARSPFAARPDGYKTVVGLVTAGGTRNGALNRIMIYSPKIPTKSGIRVGDSEEKLRATFDAFTDGGPYELTGTKGKIKFEVGSVDPQHPEASVVLAIFVVPVGDDFPSLGTDANGPCVA